ncbi:MAG: hypothetical protein Q8K60_05055, partial [Parachlamydiaceae bacterium]|nr:hypothetical protein [Parachlamydiaceae bacterium]
NYTNVNDIGIAPMAFNKTYLIKHWMYIRDLILLAEQNNVFKEAPKKLLLIKIWSNMCEDPGHPKIDLNDREFLINSFCSFDASFHCTLRAVEILIKYIKDIKPSEYENSNYLISFCDLQKIYPSVLNAIMKLDSFEGNDGKVNVLFELTKHTLRAFNEKILSTFIEIMFPFLDELIITLPVQIQGLAITQMLIMYLNFLTRILCSNPKTTEFYTSKFKHVMTHTRNNLIQHPISDTIVNVLIERIVVSLTGLKTSVNNPFNRNRRELLFNWIQLICEEYPGDFINRKCIILIHIFTRTLTRSEDFYFWFDTSNSKKNQTIKQTMIDFVEKNGTEVEKIVLKSLFLHFQIQPQDRTKYIYRLGDMINFNENICTNSTLCILKYIVNSFFLWKKDDFKTRMYQLFEQNPIEEQNVFENFLDKIRSIVEKTPDRKKINFLAGFIKQGFETQWLNPIRPKCLEFMLWAKKFLDLMFNDSPYELYNMMIELQLIHSNPEQVKEFWLNFSSKFDDFSRYILNEKNISHSWILVHNICSSPINSEIKEILCKKWISSLNEYEKRNHQPFFVQHFSDIGDYFFKKTRISIFKNHANFDPIPPIFPESYFDPEKLLEEFSLCKIGTPNEE